MTIIDLHDQPDYWKEVGMSQEDFVNRSYVIGDTIILGIYKNKERKLASFFHEIGHMVNGTGKEKEAWQTGIKLAESLGINFSIRCQKWIKKQLLSYRKGEK